jgi:hypothetical protein
MNSCGFPVAYRIEILVEQEQATVYLPNGICEKRKNYIYFYKNIPLFIYDFFRENDIKNKKMVFNNLKQFLILDVIKKCFTY